MEVARQAPPPKAARYHLDGLNQLVRLCRELQRVAGDRPFFISCRNAEAVLRVPFQTAAKWLRRLVRDGVLKRISKGSPATGQASEYRYIAD
jgi:hypothetical protein